MARGVDKVRTCRAEEGFGILEQHTLVLGNEVLELLAFRRRETSLVVFVEQPVKPCLAYGVESPQIDGYCGFSHGAEHWLILFKEVVQTILSVGKSVNHGGKLSPTPIFRGAALLAESM